MAAQTPVEIAKLARLIAKIVRPTEFLLDEPLAYEWQKFFESRECQ